ncbi:hypothetical protein GCM10020216_015290 [Nonomuraea helvata]
MYLPTHSRTAWLAWGAVSAALVAEGVGAALVGDAEGVGVGAPAGRGTSR